MLISALPYTIYPLGDSALTIDFGNSIDDTANKAAIQLFHELKKEPIPCTTALIPAYSSLSIIYNVVEVKKKCKKGQTAFDTMAEQTEERIKKVALKKNDVSNLVQIPVCYDESFAPDLISMANTLHLSPEEIIAIHTSAVYKVYMLGFLPGFAYMGIVPDKISIGRKQKPVTVEAGGVGIAGKQTGIYPLTSPGGWQIIGRTPLPMFNKKNDNPTHLHPGDEVKFYAISKKEMEEWMKKVS
jgi:inhibitor of KinA